MNKLKELHEFLGSKYNDQDLAKKTYLWIKKENIRWRPGYGKSKKEIA